MKCEVAKDLMTLYVDGMCSEVSKAELEAHLQECPECAGQLEVLQKELCNEAFGADGGGYKGLGRGDIVAEGLEGDGHTRKANYAEENEVALKPMKKVKKSLFRRKLAVVCLVFVLLVVLTGIGFLSYGQMTNRGMSFSALADAIRLKGVCEKLAEGDTQALLDVIAFRLADVYEVRQDGRFNEEFENYKKEIKRSMDEAYAYYFEGKDIEVKIEEIWLTPYEENAADDMAATSFMIGFYDGKELIYTLDFGKVTPKKFVVYEEIYDDKPTFAANLLTYDDVLLDITLRHATSRQYEKLIAGEEVVQYGSGLCLIIEKGNTEDEKSAYKKVLKEHLNQMYESKWYIKETFFAPDEYNVDKKRWIYKVWFQIEDQNTGNIAMLEQRFVYYNGDLYIIEDEEPTIMATNGEVPADVEKQLLELFH